MLILKELWMDLSPKVQNVNDISAEMNSGVIYEICLLNSRNFGQKLGGSHVSLEVIFSIIGYDNYMNK